MDQQNNDGANIIGGQERILFVDDDDVLAEIGKELLSFLGYNVTSTTGSMEALELFHNRPDQFDLVVSDLTMPNMTGLELAQELKRIRSDIPIVICTGFSEGQTAERLKAIGVTEIIMKPIAIKQIAAAIRRALA